MMNKEKIFKYFIYLNIIFFPLNIMFKVNSLGFYFQLSYLFVILFTTLYLFCIFIERNKFTDFKVIFPLCILLLVFSLSLFQSFYLPEKFSSIRVGSYVNYPFIKGIFRFGLLFVLVAFSYCIAHYSLMRKKTNELMNFYVNFTTILCLVNIISFFSDYFLNENSFSILMNYRSGDDFFPRIKGFFNEPIVMSLYLSTSLPISVSFLFNNFNLKNLINVLIQFFAFIFTFSRAGWISVLFMAILIGIFKRNFLFNHHKIIFKGFFIFFISFLFLITVSQTFNDYFSKGFIAPIKNSVDTSAGKFLSTKLRLKTYYNALESFKKHPFIGVGYSNTHFYMPIINANEIFGENFLFLDPEANNYLITLLAETGIIGFLAFAFLIYFMLKLAYAKYVSSKQYDKNTCIAFLLISVSIIVHLQFFSKIIFPFLWFVFGLGIAFFEDYRLEEAIQKRRII